MTPPKPVWVALFGVTLLGCAPDDAGGADQGTGLPGTVGDGDGDGDGDDGGGDADGDDEGDGPLLDVMAGDTDGAGDPGCGDGEHGELEFSFLWAANSGYSTVSKIDTVTLTEEGRYKTDPEFGSPSRTSVSLSGDVAIANRNGGVVKFYANAETCPDQNGVPGIQTSTGKDDVLEWGMDDCLAWHTPMNYSTQRPVAWAPGEFNEATCEWVDQHVWTVGAQVGQSGSVVVTILDGEDGLVSDEVSIPELAVGGYGPYGGAFDTEGDFWFIDSGNDGPGQELVRVRADDLTYEIWNQPQQVFGYGFTVDSKGRPWVVGYKGGTARFNPDDETWTVNPDVSGIGAQDDGEGKMWIVYYPYTYRGVLGLDLETMEQVDQVDVPNGFNMRGASFDFHGKLMVVGSTHAYRLDTSTKQVEAYEGLQTAYTYSDMTGWGLKNVTIPPQG